MRAALPMLLLTIAAGARAQVAVVEEREVSETLVVERGYVRGQGRGVQYGAHVVSPIYLTTLRSSDGSRRLDQGPGIGVHGRVGWEFPAGFTFEVLGGFAANGVDTHGLDTSDVIGRAEVGLGFRYMLFNDTALVPFAQIGGGLRWFWLEWPGATPVKLQGQLTGAVHGVLGLQIEITPYFGVEAGLAVDYTFWGEIFAEGLVSLTPFLGVTLYVYDESGH